MVLTVSVVVPEPAIVAGLKVQVPSTGNPEQLSWMVPVKPSFAPIVSTSEPAPPAITPIALPLLDKTKSGCTLIVIGAALDPV